MKTGDSPCLVCLSGLSEGLQTKGSPVRFPVRAHAWVAGQVPSRGRVRGNHTLMFLSLPFPSLKINKRKSLKKLPYRVIWRTEDVRVSGGHFRFFFFKYLIYLFIFRERGREGEREGEKHQCVVASHVAPTGDLACNPGMCPD